MGPGSCCSRRAVAPARLETPRECAAGARSRPSAAAVSAAVGFGMIDRLYWDSNCMLLAGAERDDSADGIVRRNADGHSISWNDFDSKAAHSAAQLGQNLVAGVALHAV